VRDIAAWLQGLGLAKYLKAFEDNEIDFATLPYLTEHMLEQIGLPIGPRAKLLAAISKLPSSQVPDPEHIEPAAQRQEAERRQITVMFSDLVGSTELAARLDPEELRSVLEAYQRTCGAIVERYEGYVAQYRGDGMLAYFGWPAAHEDAAERAVRAGLELVKAVNAITGPEHLAVRAGISTGIVVIGNTGLGDPSTPSDAFGETLHIAARLQALAIPNSVVISESTSRLVSARFDQEALGPQNLKGIVKPVHIFRIRRVLEDSSRFQAAHAQTLTPLVGRRAELAWLLQRWRDAADGEGQVVFISGIPGMGKSRIVYELQQLIKGELHFSLSFQCLPHCMQSALSPVIRQIERFADLTADDSNAVKLDKVKRLLSVATEKVDKAAPLVAEMISIPMDSRDAPLALTAEQLKDNTMSVLVELLLGLSAKSPVFCLLEDAQWIDPSTQELLDLVIGRIEKVPILLIVTHRPEYQMNSGVRGNVSALTMSRLGRREVAEMAQLLLHEQTATVMKRIIDDSDSIPLFVEELAHGVIDSREIAEHEIGTHRAGPSDSWSVPDSLRDTLVARLDRAPQARNVAQIAAVMGRDFSCDMLLRVSHLSNQELDLALTHLRTSGIVQLLDNRPPVRYGFKHVLLRDAAYESLLKSTRREIHARVGAAMEAEWPEIVAGQPELLAYHYSMAGCPERAVLYWLQGGQRARSRSANLEATVQFQKALELLELLPDTAEHISMQLEIQLSLGFCSIAMDGYSSDDTRKSFERACSLSVAVGEPRKEIQAIFGLWGHYWMIARHDRAIELGEMLLAKAEQLDDQIALTVGHRSLGSTLFTLGDFVRARAHLEQAIALQQAPAVDTPSLSLTYAADPRVAAQLVLAFDLWILGYPRKAHRHVVEGLAQAAKQANPYTVAFAHYTTCAVQLMRGEFRDALAHADRGLAVSREHHINLYVLYSQFARGCALAKMGQKELAIVEVRQGIEDARRINLGHMRGFMLGWLATTQAEMGDPEAALATIDSALKQINDVAGRAWEAELRRLRGDTLLVVRPNEVEEAERDFNEAITITQNQRARSFELRATTSLAKLLRRQNRSVEARQRLGPLLEWFTEGHDTEDLKRAKLLAHELA
jgi:class 3 adenylate cyclase/tetratricopeptide (TPR) repeat protein